MSIFIKILNKIELTEKEKLIYLNFIACIEKININYIFNEHYKKINSYNDLNDTNTIFSLLEKLKQETRSDFINFKIENDDDIKKYINLLFEFISDKFNNLFSVIYNLNEKTETGIKGLEELKNCEKLVSNIILKEFLNEDFFKQFNFALTDCKPIFNDLIFPKNDFKYGRYSRSHIKYFYRESVDETNDFIDSINISILKNVKIVLDKVLKNEQDVFDYFFDMINNKETEFEFSLIKKLFLNKNNLLNFKNSKNLMTEKSLNKCVDFINIKDYYDEEDENIPLITKEINNTIFGIINFIEKNKEKKYDNTINKILIKYFMSYLYVYDLEYNNIDDDDNDIVNYDYHCNFNDRKTKLFNKLKNLNSDIVNYDLLSLNLLKVECDKEYSLFVKNKDFIINNQIFLSFVKHIIENYKELLTDEAYCLNHENNYKFIGNSLVFSHQKTDVNFVDRMSYMDKIISYDDKKLNNKKGVKI